MFVGGFKDSGADICGGVDRERGEMIKTAFIISIISISLILTIAISNSYAYSVIWDDWRYFSGIWVDGEPEEETYNRSPISYYLDDNNYGKAKSGKLILKSESKAVSHDERTIDSLSLFYARVKVTGGTPGEPIPTYFDANLKGVLNGAREFTSSVGAGVLAYDYNIGFSNIIDAIQDNGSLPDPMWEWYYYEQMSSGPKMDIDYNYRELIYPLSDKKYFVLAGLITEAEVDCPSRSLSDFYGAERYFKIDLTPIPEPTTLSLLGLGLLGLVGLRRKCRYL